MADFRWQWTFLLGILLCCSFSVLWILIERFMENPTHIVQLEPKVTKKPFPAVVLCPEVDFPDHKVDAFLKNIDFPPGLNKTYVKDITQQLAAFFSPDVTYNQNELEIMQYVLDYNNIDVESAGINLTSSCADTIVKCRWRGEIVNCSSLFQMELTAYGFCCVFNGRSIKRDIKDLNFNRRVPKQRWYASNFGFTNALMLAVNQTQVPKDINLSYKWLSLHGGQRYIDMSVNGTPVSPGVELWVGYSSRTFQISDDAMRFSGRMRRCRLSSEPLKYFPIYNRNYCLMECEMERALQLCQCVQTVHPRLPGIPVCRAQSLQCARQVAVSFGEDVCSCPLMCDFDMDDTIVASYDLNGNSFSYDSFYDDLEFDKISVVRIYVSGHNKMITSRRSYFTFFNLFAQLGGVFNVFFGFSVLTLLEIMQIIWRALYLCLQSICVKT